jgi:hypothetical protein
MAINLYGIYKKVYDRNHGASGKSIETQDCSASMHEAAKIILDAQTLQSVKDFERKEKVFLNRFDVNAWYPIANDFYAAIRSKDFFVKKPPINIFRLDQNDVDGIVYFLKTSSKPKQIKIGQTTQDIYARMNQIRNKHNLPDIDMHFYISTNKSKQLEDAIQNSLKLVRVSGRVKNDSTEWFSIDRDRVVNALFRMTQKCDATVKVEWASSYYKKLLATKFSC